VDRAEAFAGLVTSPQQQTRTVLAGAWRDRQLDARCGLPVDSRICGSPAFMKRGQDGVSLLVDLPERRADWQSFGVGIGRMIGVDLLGEPTPVPDSWPRTRRQREQRSATPSSS
jgi:hypothetical protein